METGGSKKERYRLHNKSRIKSMQVYWEIMKWKKLWNISHVRFVLTDYALMRNRTAIAQWCYI